MPTRGVGMAFLPILAEFNHWWASFRKTLKDYLRTRIRTKAVMRI